MEWRSGTRASHVRRKYLCHTMAPTSAHCAYRDELLGRDDRCSGTARRGRRSGRTPAPMRALSIPTCTAPRLPPPASTKARGPFPRVVMIGQVRQPIDSFPDPRRIHPVFDPALRAFVDVLTRRAERVRTRLTAAQSPMLSMVFSKASSTCGVLQVAAGYPERQDRYDDPLQQWREPDTRHAWHGGAV